MRYARSAQAGVQDFLDEEIDRRRAIIAGETPGGLPSLAPYLHDIRALRPLTGVENELFNKTIELVKQQEQKDRDDLYLMMEYDSARMSILKGENPSGVDDRFQTEYDYIQSVRALGELSSEESRVYTQWQTVVLDTIADWRALQEDVAYHEHDDTRYQEVA